jgi:excisionase family DNA binding protein
MLSLWRGRSAFCVDELSRRDREQAMMPPEEEWLTKVELAAYLRVSLSTVNRLLRDNALPGVKLGRAVRFRRTDLLRWLDTPQVPRDSP